MCEIWKQFVLQYARGTAERSAGVEGMAELRENTLACFHPHIPPLAFYNAPTRVGSIVLNGGTIF